MITYCIHNYSVKALVAGILLVTACGPRGPVAPEGQSPLSAQGRVGVTVGPQSIRPQTLTLASGVPTQIQITNTGEACVFYVSHLLTGLLVMPGQTDDVSFLFPPPVPGAQDAGADLTLGCLGQPARQAKLVLANPADVTSQPALVVATATPQSERQLSVMLKDDGLEPRQVDLRYGVPVHLTVTNRGDACLFSLGDYLRGLTLPRNGTATATFTPLVKAPPPQGTPGSTPAAGGSFPSAPGAASPAPPAGITMGCLGDPNRQGILNIR